MIIIENIINRALQTLKKTRYKENVLSVFKLILFSLILFSIYLVFAKTTLISILLLVSFLVLFITTYIISSKYLEEISFNENILKVCDEIVNEKSKDVYKISELIEENHSFSNDLDIFGKNSLFEKINRCQTYLGVSKLKYSLLNPIVNEKEIVSRQEAIKELSQKVEWDIFFLANTKAIQSGDENKNRIIDNDGFKKINTSFFRKTILFFPFFSVFSILFFIYRFDLISFTSLLVSIISSLIISRVYNQDIEKIYLSINYNSKYLKKYATVFSLIEKETYNSEYNKSLQLKLSYKDFNVSYFIKKFFYLINQYENKDWPLVGPLLNIILLWDLRFGYKIGKLIDGNEKEIPKWFDIIGEFEVLISFGLFAYKNEQFNYPVFTNNSSLFEGTKVSHPLIQKDFRISNDFIIDSKNNISIITGANMTGKSTFLRTIGINLVLAMNGCPVCADSFKFKPISIFTSMRTSDSLSSGSSYFHAEIKRLKSLITKLENNEPQFILLDEILKGTNSEDKLKGSKLFLEKMMSLKTEIICLIATHDLDLTKMANEYPNNIKNYCFELEKINTTLKPDYLLKNGVTQKMNAISLMKEYKIID